MAQTKKSNKHHILIKNIDYSLLYHNLGGKGKDFAGKNPLFSLIFQHFL